MPPNKRWQQDYRIGTYQKMSMDIDATPSVVAYSAQVVHHAVPI